MAGVDDGVEAWGDAVGDLADKGDVDGAISLLESIVFKLEKLSVSSAETDYHLRLANALVDLADLHSSRGFSMMADELRSRALIIRLLSTLQSLHQETRNSLGIILCRRRRMGLHALRTSAKKMRMIVRALRILKPPPEKFCFPRSKRK